MSLEEKHSLFLPSKNAWHFLNDFQFHYFRINAGIYFCGGMCRSAIKRFIKRVSIPKTTTPPGQHTDLYKEIFNNQIKLTLASVFKIYYWQTYPFKKSFFRNHSIGNQTKKEWETLKAEIKKGKPALICIIRSEGYNPISLFHNHWMIGWRYSYDKGQKMVFIWVYDPNFPDSDDGYIKLDFSCPKSEIEPWYSRGDRVRGFFVKKL